MLCVSTMLILQKIDAIVKTQTFPPRPVYCQCSPIENYTSERERKILVTYTMRLSVCYNLFSVLLDKKLQVIRLFTASFLLLYAGSNKAIVFITSKVALLSNSSRL